MNDVIISPSILSADFANLARDIGKIERAGADWVHVDVMDGSFVPNITIGACVVKDIKPVTDLPLDVHLMIADPEKYIPDFAKAGADILTFHLEAVDGRVLQIVEQIKSYGKKVGISIKPKTTADKIFPYLDFIDLVLVMTVEPGFGGQSFMYDCVEKISIIRKQAKGDLIIQVDGGINAETGKLCKDAGANSLVAGSYIYGAQDVNQAIDSLR